MSFLNKLEERETFGFVIDSYSITVILELFFWIDPNFTDYPSMTLHFQGADWPLPKEYVYIFNTAGEKYFCVALLPDDRLTIIGAYHQQNVLVIYDVGNNRLQFAPVVCKGPK